MRMQNRRLSPAELVGKYGSLLAIPLGGEPTAAELAVLNLLLERVLLQARRNPKGNLMTAGKGEVHPWNGS